jgi:hypothetical protein
VPNIDEEDMANPDTVNIMHGRIDRISAIRNNDIALLEGYYLDQNYPNPFNPVTEISFTVGKAGNYEIAVYNLLGQKVHVLESARMTAGSYTVMWDGKDKRGIQVASGLYFYQLKGEDVMLTRKMMLIR